MQPTDSAAPPDSTTLRLERSYVVAIELVEQRPGEGVADDEQEVDALALDDAPDVDRVEVLGIGRARTPCRRRARR